MKTINFSDRELESMIEMYTAEMEEAQMYLAQIKDILKKLGAKPTKEKVTENETKHTEKGSEKGGKEKIFRPEPNRYHFLI